MKRFLLVASVVLATGLVALAQGPYPALELQVDSLTPTYVYGLNGMVSYTSPNYHGWDIWIDTGKSNSPTLNPFGLSLTIDAQCNGTCSALDVYLSDNSFTQPVLAFSQTYSATITQGQGASTTQNAWLDYYDFWETYYLGTVGPFTGSGGQGTVSDALDPSSGYSLTMEDTFAACSGGNCPSYSSNGDITSAVPEPASLALFGSGLLGLAGLARRRFLK